MSILPEGIIFVREGLSKQDRPGHVGKHIFIPCLKRNIKLDQKGLCRLISREQIS